MVEMVERLEMFIFSRHNTDTLSNYKGRKIFKADNGNKV